jgi:hypothetical protein
VTWGWRIQDNGVALSPPTLTLGDSHSASTAFFKAAQRWNTMLVPDMATSTTQPPVFALPTIDQEFTRGSAPFEAALRGDDKDAMVRGRELALVAWRKLSSGEKAHNEGRLLDLLDRYEMKANARRPSQLALKDQYQV